MGYHRFIRKGIDFWLGSAFFLLLTLSQVMAQLPPEVARVGYADTIFVNGKIVSMDDVSNSTEVGRIYQALAVKGERIMKLGTSEEVRPLAGPETKVLDLRGRTLIPGIIEPHSHIYGRVTSLLDRLGFEYPPQRCADGDDTGRALA